MKSNFLALISMLCFTVLFTGNTIAQVHVGGIEEYIDYANINKTNAGVNNSYNDIDGSPFLFEDFVTGRIKLENGKIYEGPLRYDIYADQIEFKNSNGEIFAVLNQEAIESVSLKEKNFIHLKNDVGNIKGGFFETSGEADYILLTKYGVELKEAEPARPYIEPKPARFINKKNKYVIVDENGEMIELKSKSDLQKIGSNRSGDIAKFIKKSRIKITDKEGLLKYIQHLNDL